jgi:hypothetical protein
LDLFLHFSKRRVFHVHRPPFGSGRGQLVPNLIRRGQMARALIALAVSTRQVSHARLVMRLLFAHLKLLAFLAMMDLSLMQSEQSAFLALAILFVQVRRLSVSSVQQVQRPQMITHAASNQLNHSYQRRNPLCLQSVF